MKNPPAFPGLREHVDLTPFNTMNLPAQARFFIEICTVEELRLALRWADRQAVAVLPLGEGSNVILHDNYPGLVLLIRLPGKAVIEKKDDSLLLCVAAGERWRELVLWAIAQGYHGLENLSDIPGCVGAAPIQNIGAYGVELVDVFHSLTAVDRHSGQQVEFNRSDCAFGYRDSLFKHTDHRYIITSVTFKLSRRFMPKLQYGGLHEAVLQSAGQQAISAQLVSEIVSSIRRQKLPSRSEAGSAGSFFKNPIVSTQRLQKLRVVWPDIVAYSCGPDRWKLAAAWLIDQCGYRGVTRTSGAGVYERQALVLVNWGGANGHDILSLANEVRDKTRDRFGIDLEFEAQVYPRRESRQ